MGRKTFQPSLINWSYRYRGRVARTHKKQKSIKVIFSKNQITPGIWFNGFILNGGSQPPKNRMLAIALINIIAAYSPRKNKAKGIDEYSTKYPATREASSSGRSNGCRLVSARADTKKIINIGNKGIKNHVVDKDVKLKVNQTHKQFQAVNFLQRNRNWANGLLFIPTSWANAEYTLFETIKIIDIPTSIIYFNEPFALGGKEDSSIMVGNNMESFTGEPLEVCERGLDRLIT